MKQYDVVVLGGGPGGYIAAIRCAQLGLRAAVAEQADVGGTCLNKGCIPTKTLLHSAKLYYDVCHGAEFGIDLDNPRMNMPVLQKRRQNVINTLRGGVEMLLKGRGVTILRGFAQALSSKEVLINEEIITCENIIIATGSSNAVPPIPGLSGERIYTSTDMLKLDYIPESLVIIGGGVIGCEFASVFASFGTKVTIVEMQPELLAQMDKSVSQEMLRSFKRFGIKVLADTSVQKVEPEDNMYLVRLSGDKEPLQTQCILVSTGRKANTAGLEKLNLEYTRGYITVDAQMRTNVENVYAIGDVTGIFQLAHIASAQGIVAAENIAGLQKNMDYHVVPSCVYTNPEIGAVGLTEKQAREQFEKITTAVFPMASSGKALSMGEVSGFTKLIAETESKRLLGCHTVGANATEIISEAAAVMQAGGTLSDIAETIHAHPTINETLMEAANKALGRPIHTM